MSDAPATRRSFRVDTGPWVTFQPALDDMLEPLGEAVMARLLVRRGEQVLDVGCGAGATTRELARIVTHTGQVTGIDVAADLLGVADDATILEGLGNITLIDADAGGHPFAPASFDVIFSRLGTMFFDEPGAAFANLRRALRPGGRLGFVCWRSPEENGWVTGPRDAAAMLLPTPPPSSGPSGPFSLASKDHIAALLSGAGFVDVEIEPHDEPLQIGRGDVEEAVDFYLHLLPTGYLLVEPDRHYVDRLRAALRTVIDAHRTSAGIWMGSATWVVTAR